MSYSTYVSPEDGRLKRSKHIFIKLKKLVVSNVSCITVNLKAQPGCPTLKLCGRLSIIGIIFIWSNSLAKQYNQAAHIWIPCVVSSFRKLQMRLCLFGILRIVDW
jgi:hypothetical protein